MANVTYQDLLHDVALRMNALVGGTVADINTTYDNSVLNASHFKSADWPFASFKDAILMAMGDFAWAIADTGGHPWRLNMLALTNSLGSNSRLPGVASNGKQIIGTWGVVRDAENGTALTEQPLDVVRRANQETWRKYPLYYFKIDDGLIVHTRPNVALECCSYSPDEQSSNFDLNIVIVPVPGILRPAIVARAISLMVKDGAFADQAAIYRGYSEEALVRIRGGLTTVPSKTLPSPTMSQT